jgi:hypothetical protein
MAKSMKPKAPDQPSGVFLKREKLKLYLRIMLLKYIKEISIYFFSDGLPDQFGGPEGRKYFPKRIKQHILDNQKECQ